MPSEDTDKDTLFDTLGGLPSYDVPKLFDKGLDPITKEHWFKRTIKFDNRGDQCAYSLSKISPKDLRELGVDLLGDVLEQLSSDKEKAGEWKARIYQFMRAFDEMEAEEDLQRRRQEWNLRRSGGHTNEYMKQYGFADYSEYMERKVFQVEVDIYRQRSNAKAGYLVWTDNKLAPYNFRPSKNVKAREPPLTMRPGNWSPGVHKAVSDVCDRHLYSIMQHKNAQMFRYTIEFDSDPMGIDRTRDWRLILERRYALKLMINKWARQMGILFAIDGIETHGATKKFRSHKQEDPNQVNPTDKKKKKKKTMNQKKHHLNTFGGGNPDRSDDEDEAHQREALEEAEQAAPHDDERQAAEKKARTEAILQKANNVLSRKKGALEEVQLAIKEHLAGVDEEEQQNREVLVGAQIESLRDLIEVYSNKKFRTMSEDASLAIFKQTLETLRTAMPNTRHMLSHIELVMAVTGDAEQPPDPGFFSRQVAAPLKLKCEFDPANRRVICAYCGEPCSENRTYMQQATCKNQNDTCFETYYGKILNRRTPWDTEEERTAPMHCFPCIRCAYCDEAHEVNYYDATYDWVSHGHEVNPYPPMLPDSIGALYFSFVHGGGYNWKDPKPQVWVDSLGRLLSLLTYRLESNASVTSSTPRDRI